MFNKWKKAFDNHVAYDALHICLKLITIKSRFANGEIAFFLHLPLFFKAPCGLFKEHETKDQSGILL